MDWNRLARGLAGGMEGAAKGLGQIEERRQWEEQNRRAQELFELNQELGRRGATTEEERLKADVKFKQAAIDFDREKFEEDKGRYGAEAALRTAEERYRNAAAAGAEFGVTEGRELLPSKKREAEARAGMYESYGVRAGSGQRGGVGGETTTLQFAPEDIEPMLELAGKFEARGMKPSMSELMQFYAMTQNRNATAALEPQQPNQEAFGKFGGPISPEFASRGQIPSEPDIPFSQRPGGAVGAAGRAVGGALGRTALKIPGAAKSSLQWLLGPEAVQGIGTVPTPGGGRMGNIQNILPSTYPSHLPKRPMLPQPRNPNTRESIDFINEWIRPDVNIPQAQPIDIAKPPGYQPQGFDPDSIATIMGQRLPIDSILKSLSIKGMDVEPLREGYIDIPQSINPTARIQNLVDLFTARKRGQGYIGP